MSYQAKPLYMPWNEEAFRADIDVQIMSCAERNAYRCLLQSLFWQSSRPYVQNDEKVLQISANCENHREWRKVSKAVLRKFRLITIEGAEYWENPRATRDWERIKGKRERLSENGKRSATLQQLSGNCQTIDQPFKREVKEKLKRSYSEEKLEGSEVTADEDTTMKQFKILGIIAGRELGITRLPSMTGWAKDRIEVVFRAYGDQQVQDDFEAWCRERTDNPPQYPIQDYLREVDTRLGNAKPEEKNPAIERLSTLTYRLTKKVPNPFEVQRLLESFPEDQIESALREFVGNLNESDMDYAAKKFFNDNGCAAVLAARQILNAEAKQKQEREQEEQRMIENHIANAKKESDARLAEIKARANEPRPTPEQLFGSKK